MQIVEEESGSGKRGGQGHEKGGKGDSRARWTCGQLDTLHRGV